jgi:hypothetical protein
VTSTPPEQALAELLDSVGFEYQREALFEGHRIDFLIDAGSHVVLAEPNGDRWHRWSKIVDCDRKKLNRVLSGPMPAVPLGIWWSRLQRDPHRVLDAVTAAIVAQRLCWWDWAVKIDSLDAEPRLRLQAMMNGVPR